MRLELNWTLEKSLGAWVLIAVSMAAEASSPGLRERVESSRLLELRCLSIDPGPAGQRKRIRMAKNSQRKKQFAGRDKSWMNFNRRVL